MSKRVLTDKEVGRVMLALARLEDVFASAGRPLEAAATRALYDLFDSGATVTLEGSGLKETT